MNKSVGAVVHFNSEIESARQAGNSFARVYGEENLVYQTNNKNSFYDLQDSLEKEILFGFPYKGPLQQILRKPDSFTLESKSQCLINQMTNIKESLEYLETEFVVWLHPDHRILRKIPDSKLDLDLEQEIRNKYSNNSKRFFEEVTSHRLERPGYGIPSYHKRMALLNVVKYLIDNEESMVKPLILKSVTFLNDDVIMPMTHELLGFTIGNRKLTRDGNGFSEYLKVLNPSIIHQVKIEDKLP